MDTYNAEGLNGHGPGNQAAWCGSLAYPSCAPDDPEGGYGSLYDDILDWHGTVGDNSAPCTVSVEAWLNHNLEPGYDFLTLLVVNEEEDEVEIWSTDGVGINIHLEESFLCIPEDYVGENQDQVHIKFQVTSDIGWDDSDCYYYGDGACQLDDISVILDNGSFTTFDDFEDGSLGNWEIGFNQGYGA